MTNLGVLVSGTGTNLQAILDAVEARTLDANVSIVISNEPGALALERARRAGISTRTISHRAFQTREDFDAALVAALKNCGVDWVILAGFMRLLTPVFLTAYPWRVINVHPALLPAFPGVNAQKQALDYGVKVAGCTVHFVDSGTDTGPIIAQRAVEVKDDDDLEALRLRILAAEHDLLTQVLRSIVAGELQVRQEAAGRSRVLLGRP